MLRGAESVQSAVDAPNIIARGDTVRVETGKAANRKFSVDALGYEKAVKQAAANREALQSEFADQQAGRFGLVGQSEAMKKVYA